MNISQVKKQNSVEDIVKLKLENYNFILKRLNDFVPDDNSINDSVLQLLIDFFLYEDPSKSHFFIWAWNTLVMFNEEMKTIILNTNLGNSVLNDFRKVLQKSVFDNQPQATEILSSVKDILRFKINLKIFKDYNFSSLIDSLKQNGNFLPRNNIKNPFKEQFKRQEVIQNSYQLINHSDTIKKNEEEKTNNLNPFELFENTAEIENIFLVKANQTDFTIHSSHSLNNLPQLPMNEINDNNNVEEYNFKNLMPALSAEVTFISEAPKENKEFRLEESKNAPIVKEEKESSSKEEKKKKKKKNKKKKEIENLKKENSKKESKKKQIEKKNTSNEVQQQKNVLNKEEEVVNSQAENKEAVIQNVENNGILGKQIFDQQSENKGVSISKVENKEIELKNNKEGKNQVENNKEESNKVEDNKVENNKEGNNKVENNKIENNNSQPEGNQEEKNKVENNNKNLEKDKVVDKQLLNKESENKKLENNDESKKEAFIYQKLTADEKALKRYEDLLTEICKEESLIDFIRNNKESLFNKIGSLIGSKIIIEKYYNEIFTIYLYIHPFLNEKQRSTVSILPYKFPRFIDGLLYSNHNKNWHISKVVYEAALKSKVSRKALEIAIDKMKTDRDIKNLYLVSVLLDSLKCRFSSKIQEKTMIFCIKVGFILGLIINYQEKSLKKDKIINELLYELYLIKTVYKNYPNKLKCLSYKDYKYFIGDEAILRKEEIKTAEYFNHLLNEEQIQNFNLTMKKINNFFKVNPNDFCIFSISKDDLNFLLRNSEINFYNQKYLYSNISEQIKTKLYLLEYQLLENISNNMIVGEISSYSISKEIKEVYDELDKIIHLAMKKYESVKDIEFNLLPCGSIAEFLDCGKSDLDLYIDVHSINQKDKIEIVNKIAFFIKTVVDPCCQNINSKRIVLLSFAFRGVKIDLTCLGICAYFHSNIIRSYVLIDPRVKVLAINIKNLMKEIGLIKKPESNDLEKKATAYLNSFSLMMLLIVFLQDCVDPPILPKIQEENSYLTTITVDIGGANHNNYSFPKRKTIRNVFLYHTKEIDINVSKIAYNDMKEIYKEKIKKINKMSNSQLFLKFLEFILCYLKPDTLFVNFSHFNEGIQNRSQINYSIDQNLRDFYFRKYCLNQQGKILFREPFDAHYNPGHDLNDYDEFITKIKKKYINIISTGKL